MQAQDASCGAQTGCQGRDAVAALASAQTVPKCPTHEATIFFAPDSSELNKFSSYTVNEMADAARACGSKGVIVQLVGHPVEVGRPLFL